MVQADPIMPRAPQSPRDVVTNLQPVVPQPTTPERTVIANSVRLSVPLDASSKRVVPVYPDRKLARRDSMDRREALLKGKEGSRQRRRWENGRRCP